MAHEGTVEAPTAVPDDLFARLRQRLASDVPPHLREVTLLRALLHDDLDRLLGTDDLELLDVRWRHLLIDETDDFEREQVSEALERINQHRPSWWERVRRLTEVVIATLLLAVILVAITCVLVPEVPFLRRTSWLGWPIPAGTFAKMVSASIAAAMLGLGVTWFHLRDEVRTARMALRAVLALDASTWPGLPVVSPVARLTAWWSWAALLSGGLGTVLVLAGTMWANSSVLATLFGLVLLVLGALCVVVALRRHRLDREVRRTLFVGPV